MTRPDSYAKTTAWMLAQVALLDRRVNAEHTEILVLRYDPAVPSPAGCAADVGVSRDRAGPGVAPKQTIAIVPSHMSGTGLTRRGLRSPDRRHH